jgi:hypothetical protein
MRKIRQIGEAINSSIPSDLNDSEFKDSLVRICDGTAKTCKRGTWPEVGHFTDVTERINNLSKVKNAELSGVSDWVLDTDKVYRDRLARGERVCVRWLENHEKEREYYED